MQFRTVDGLSIRFAESDEKGNEHALLFSPWPESLLAYASMWQTLTRNVHVIAVDLPGFGHSEGREDVLSPQAMGEFVVHLADAFGLERPHAVGPDVGTAALLFAAATHADRFRSIVVGTGATSYPLELGEPLASWVTSPDLDAYRQADPRKIVATALSTIAPAHSPPEWIQEDHLSAYLGDRFVESMRYVRAIPPSCRSSARCCPTCKRLCRSSLAPATG
jgi:pimeloyl-ACP methyl ester carboxylesterase